MSAFNVYRICRYCEYAAELRADADAALPSRRDSWKPDLVDVAVLVSGVDMMIIVKTEITRDSDWMGDICTDIQKGRFGRVW